MIRFIKINSFYDIDKLNDLFITKSLLNKGRIQIGDLYITFNENSRTYMILVEDLNKRNIANCIYSKEWFESNILNTIKTIVSNFNQDSYNY